MNVDAVVDRARCTTDTQGTGSYVLSAAAINTAHVHPSAAGHAKRVVYVCSNATAYEIGYGTVSIGGSVTVTRDEIIKSSNAGNAVSWPAGTKDFWLDVPAQDVVLRNRTNVFSADQDLDGNALLLSPDGNTYLESATNGQVDIALGTGGSVTLAADGTFRFRDVNGGVNAGAGLVLDNESDTPATNDTLLPVSFQGRDSAGNATIYGQMQAGIVDATNGSEDGRVWLRHLNGASLVDSIKLEGSAVILDAGLHLLTGGKVTIDDDSAGVEIRNSGRVSIRAASATAFVAGRNDDGTLCSWRVNSVQQGSISISGTTVSYNTFSANHWSWGELPADLPIGALLSAVDADYRSIDGERTRLPTVRVTDVEACRAVYGVYAGEIVDEATLATAELDERLRLDPALAAQLVSREIILEKAAPAQELVQLRSCRILLASGEVAETWWADGCEPPAPVPPGTPVYAVHEQPRPLRSTVSPVSLAPSADKAPRLGVLVAETVETMALPSAKLEACRLAAPGLDRRIVQRQPIKPPAPPVQRERIRFRRILVAALGIAPDGILAQGPVEPGDLLEAVGPTAPGVARRQDPERPDWRAVVGKAWGTVPAGETRLVRASLHAS